MLAIARALVGSPRLLLLDEISMGLAPMVVGELYELVAHIAADGVTVIVVEQFVSTAVRVADHAAILLHGRVHQQGAPTRWPRPPRRPTQLRGLSSPPLTPRRPARRGLPARHIR